MDGRHFDVLTRNLTANGTRRSLLAVLLGTSLGAPTWAQNFPVTPAQQATASQVAQNGVPLSELSPDAPPNYTVKAGDTLWGISGLYLKSPWRWPELWGMNLADIKNPHRIYPGQQLFLETRDGRARLSTKPPEQTDAPAMETIRVTPRTRFESLADAALPTLKGSLIEPFLSEPIIVDEKGLSAAARIVAAAQEGKVLLTRGDRAYARGQAATPLADAPGQPGLYRIFRNALPLKRNSTVRPTAVRSSTSTDPSAKTC